MHFLTAAAGLAGLATTATAADCWSIFVGCNATVITQHGRDICNSRLEDCKAGKEPFTYLESAPLVPKAYSEPSTTTTSSSSTPCSESSTTHSMTSSSTASTTSCPLVCNPAHQYPYGTSCVLSAGCYVFSTSSVTSTSTPAPTTSCPIVCNPA